MRPINNNRFILLNAPTNEVAGKAVDSDEPERHTKNGSMELAKLFFPFYPIKKQK